MMRNVRESDRLVPLEGVGLLPIGDEGTNPGQRGRLAPEDRLPGAPGLGPARDQCGLTTAGRAAQQVHLPGGQVDRNRRQTEGCGGISVGYQQGTLPVGRLLAYHLGNKPTNVGVCAQTQDTSSCVNSVTQGNIPSLTTL